MADKRKTGKKSLGGTKHEPSDGDESKGDRAVTMTEFEELNERVVRLAEQNARLEERSAAQTKAIEELNARLEERSVAQTKMLEKLLANTAREDQAEAESEAGTPTGPGGALDFTPAPSARHDRRRTTFQPTDGAFARPSTSTSVREAEARGIMEKAKKSFVTTYSGDDSDVLPLVQWLTEAEESLLGEWKLEEHEAVRVAAGNLRGTAQRRWITARLSLRERRSWDQFKNKLLSLWGALGTETEAMADTVTPQRADESFDELVCRHAQAYDVLKLRFGVVVPEAVRIRRVLDGLRDRNLAHALKERQFVEVDDLLDYVHSTWHGATAIPAESSPMTSNHPVPPKQRKAVVAAVNKSVSWADTLVTEAKAPPSMAQDLAQQMGAIVQQLKDAVSALKTSGERAGTKERGNGNFARPPSPRGECYGCGQTGHFQRNCPKARRSPTRFMGACYGCGEKGHRQSECTSARRDEAEVHPGKVAAMQAEFEEFKKWRDESQSADGVTSREC